MTDTLRGSLFLEMLTLIKTEYQMTIDDSIFSGRNHSSRNSIQYF